MSGSFVDIPSRTVNPSSMYTEIQDTITYTRDYADEMRDMLLDAVADLQALVAAYAPPVIEDVDTDITSLDRPVMPPAPTLEDFTSCIFSILCTKISDDIVNGGTGLTEPVYNAIIARELEARRVNQDREYRNALDSVGASGFDLPSGQIAGLQIEIMRERLAKDQDALNLLVVKDFDLATENTRFAVTTGVELEKLLLAGWEASEKNKVIIYDSQVKGVVGEYQALTAWVQAEVAVITLEVNSAISKGKIHLDAYTAVTQLSEKISEAIANVSAQSVASALGAINTSLSNSSNASQSLSEGWSHGESLSEAHNYTEE